MIKLVNINDIKWNDYVRKLCSYDVFYLKEYVEAFANESKENGEPILFIYENNEDYAINVAFKRDVSQCAMFEGKIEERKYYDLISPYGYGGFYGNVRDYDTLNKEYTDICIQNGFICEFVRFELFSDYSKFFQGEVETRTHNVVRDLTISMDEMWMDFRQSVRKNVKRANKNGLQIVIDEDGTRLQEFLDIYYGTMERTNAKGEFFFSRSFFEKINLMSENKAYFHVLHEGKVISTELIIYGAESAYSYLGGTNSIFFELRPNDFLKYEIIKWCKEKGLKRFVLGGGYGADDGIFQYKSHFAPDGIVDFYIGKRVLDYNKYDLLTSIRKEISVEPVNDNFFPVYRS